MNKQSGQIAMGLMMSFMLPILAGAGFVWDVKGDVKVLQTEKENIEERIDRFENVVNGRFDRLEDLIINKK